MLEHLGVALGFGAAAMQSASYIFSGECVRRYKCSSIALVARAYIVASLLSLAILPLAWPRTRLPGFSTYAVPAAISMAWCWLGHIALFILMRTVEASRASPLLGLKIVVLFVTSLIFGSVFNCGMVIAVLMSAGAAIMLGYAGKQKMTLKAYLFLLVTCVAYSLSDYYIRIFFDAALSGVREIGGAEFVRGSISVTLVTTVIGGVFGVLALPFFGRFDRKFWTRYAAPYGTCWLGAMLLLYPCFGLIGVVHGNIIQSTRGMISVLFGYLLSRFTSMQIEAKAPRSMMLRRAFAAALMFAAVILYTLASH